jgi:hypothetical protein
MRYKECMFAWNRSLMKGTSLEIKVLFRVKVAFYVRDVTQRTHCDMYTHALQRELVWLKSVFNEGHFIGDRSTFSCVTRLQYEGCYWKDTSRHVHACATKRGSLVEIGLQWRALHWRSKYFLVCNSPSMWAILLKGHTSTCTRMRYKEM